MVNEIQDRHRKWSNLILLIASLIIIAAVCLWAISIVGTPETVRNQELDRSRVEDLQRIRSEIEVYFRRNSELPSELKRLNLKKDILQDPESGNSYGYVIVDAKHYTLSAEFTLEGDQDRFYSFQQTDWSHPSGVHHFSFSTPQE